MDFSRFKDRRGCAAAVVCVLGMAERVMCGGSTGSFADWDAILDFGENTGIRSKSSKREPVFRVLIDRDRYRNLKPQQIRGNAELERIGDLMSEYAKCHLRAVKDLPQTDDAKRSAFDVIERVAKDSRWFPTELVRAEKDLASGADITVGRFLASAFRTVSFPHPDFPWMEFKDEAGVMVEYHDPANRQNGSRPSELYAVVREARGWVVEEEEEMNLLVRDLLWLAPERDKENINRGGHYYSAYDAALYRIEIHSEDATEENVYADASVAKGENHRNRFRLVFPMMRRASSAVDFRQGIISGTGRTKHQLAAWRAVLISPGQIWPEARRFQGLLDYLSQRREEDIGRAIVSAGYCGALFGSKFRADPPLDHKNREAFRRLATLPLRGAKVNQSIEGFLKDELRDGIRDLVTSITDTGPVSQDLVQEVTDTLFSTLQETLMRRWHLFEPMQIINFESREADDKEDRVHLGYLETLLLSEVRPIKPQGAG